MDIPKRPAHRPRKRPFAAHNARAVVSRAENAARWLRELRWRLDAEPEVLRCLYARRKTDIAWLYGHSDAIVATLDRLVASLADPAAPEEEGAGDGV